MPLGLHTSKLEASWIPLGLLTYKLKACWMPLCLPTSKLKTYWMPLDLPTSKLKTCWRPPCQPGQHLTTTWPDALLLCQDEQLLTGSGTAAATTWNSSTRWWLNWSVIYYLVIVTHLCRKYLRWNCTHETSQKMCWKLTKLVFVYMHTE